MIVAISVAVAAFLIHVISFYFGFRHGVRAAYRHLALERNQVPPFNRKRK